MRKNLFIENNNLSPMIEKDEMSNQPGNRDEWEKTLNIPGKGKKDEKEK